MAENQNPTPEANAEEVEKVGLVRRVRNKVQSHPRSTGAALGVAGTIGALALLAKAAGQSSRPASSEVIEGEVIHSSTDTHPSEA